MTKRNIKVHQPIYQVINWLHLFTKIKKNANHENLSHSENIHQNAKETIELLPGLRKTNILKSNWKFID